MKLQHLAVIFVIIILPVSLVIGEYIGAQVDTIYLQTSYNKKLQDATYDAIRAFQLNTVNNKYSSVSDSKIRDIEASISTFYNSLGTSMGASGYDERELRDHVPAILYTMYDGYYIYGKYFNNGIAENNNGGQYQYGLKPYIYYSCRYKKENDYDVVINYTLDNNITVYGKVNGTFVTKSGYVIDPSLVKYEEDENSYVEDKYEKKYPIKVKYDKDDNEITIQREILTENLPEVDATGKDITVEYEYTYYNNQKIYKYNNEDKYFLFKNNQKEEIPSDENRVIRQGEVTENMYAQMMTEGGHLYSNSAVEYYVKAQEFSEWLESNLGNIKQSDAIDVNGKKIEFATKIEDETPIFKFGTNNNPLVEGSAFNEHRLNVIRNSIESNLSTAIANYNVGTSEGYQFFMPLLNDEDWYKIENNISVSVFLQGLPIKSKYYNSYCIITNDKNEEVVTEDSIYVLAAKNKNTEAEVVEAHMPGCKDLIDNSSNYDLNIATKSSAYKVIDFERQTLMKTENDERYYYPQAYTRCYHCIVNVSDTYDVNDIIAGNLKKYDINTETYVNASVNGNFFKKLRTTYLTALGRERYDLYRTNGSFGL